MSVIQLKSCPSPSSAVSYSRLTMETWKHGSRHAGVFFRILLLGIVLIGQPALATEVYINEMTIRQPGQQWIEFYNASDEWVYLNDGSWSFQWNDSTYTYFWDTEVMEPGGYGFAALAHPPSLKGVTTLIETARGRDGYTRTGDRVGGEDIADAVFIPGIPYMDTGNTCAFVHDYDEICPYTNSTAPDVVYAYIPPSDDVVDIDLCGSDYDTKVYVYENVEGNLYACNDDFYYDYICGYYVSKIERVTLAAGNTYYIVIDGSGTDCGDYVLEISLNSMRDRVSYGQLGSAPLPPVGMTLARSPDAGAGTPPPPDPATDGLVWTIDFTPSIGSPNDPPQPLFPSFHWINEFDPTPIGGNDPFELHNWTIGPLVVDSWFLVSADSIVPFTGTIPSGGFLTLLTGPGIDLETSGIIYLFDQVERRVDQLGFHDALPLDPGECYGRCPDGGDLFYLGYDYRSSGGNHAFMPQTCSQDGSNAYPCTTTAVGDPGTRVGSRGITQIRPNPFSPRTAIHFELAEAEAVTLQIYDAAGRLVRRLVEGDILQGGQHEIVWTGVDDAGQVVRSGIYFVRLNSLRQGSVDRIVLLR